MCIRDSSYSNGTVRAAVEAAAARGVEIRFLYETAYDDRRLEGEALLSSRSGQLEEAGVDVRWVNKIMHHKFMIIDGPRADLERAQTATIASGSANWSNSAGTRYDENTLFLKGHEELALRMQQEFNHLWEHSRALDINEDLSWELSEASISEGQTPPEELNLALLPSTSKVPTEVDAPTPAEMAADGGLPVRAEGDAPVRTVVACADYDCEFCDKARVTLDQVLDEYPDLQLAWMQFPLHDRPSALIGARAAVAAQAQGKFWEMHALLFDRPAQRDESDVRAMAKELDLDFAQFERDFAADSTLETIDAQKASCVAAGAMGTPSFFFGDTVMVGAQPIEAFRKLLD